MPVTRLGAFGWMTLLRMLGLLVSFANQALVGAHFGADWRMDAFLLATGVVYYVDTVLTASFQKVFVPALIARRSDPEAMSRFAGQLVGLVLMILAVATTLMCVAAGPVMDLVASGASPATRELATRFLAFLAFESVFSGLFSLSWGMHLASESYLPSSMANRVTGVLLLLGLLLIVPLFNDSPVHAIWAYAAITFGAGVGQALVMAWTLRFTPNPLRIRWGRPPREVVEALAGCVPLMIGAMFVQSMALVDKWIGTRLGEGAVSWLGYAQKLTQIPLVLFGSLALISFPAISASADNPGNVWHTSARYYRAGLMLILPFALVTYLAAGPVVSFIYRQGAFSVADAAGAAAALKGYALYLAFGFVGSPLMQPFYALRRHKTVMVLAALVLFINIPASLWLAGRIGHAGVAWGSSIAYAAAALMFWIALAGIIRPKAWSYPLTGMLQLLVAALAGALAGWAAAKGLQDFAPLDAPKWRQLAAVCAITAAVFPAYALVLWLIRFAEFDWLLARLSGGRWGRAAGPL